MSTREGLGDATFAERRPGRVFILLPLLIVVLGAAAILLAQLSGVSTTVGSGYGVDETVAETTSTRRVPQPTIALDR